MKLARGVVTQHMKTFGETTETGTQVTFKPDGEIFKEGTDFDYDTLKVRMRELAFLNKGLTITLTDVRDGATHQDVFCYAGGIVEFIKFLNEGKIWWIPASFLSREKRPCYCGYRHAVPGGIQ